MFSSLSDEACIKQFQKTKEEAVFNCLLNRHRMSIRRILYSILKGTTEDMEDIEQEVAIALYQNLLLFSFKSSFRTFLFRLCRNKTIDFIRKKEKHRSILKKIIFTALEKHQETPDEIMMKKNTLDEITETLFELPEIERSLIILKDVEHLSLEEIGKIVHKPVGTVKSRLHRARFHAAEILKKKETI